jgi:anti-sigma B factor antagonist
VERSSGAAPPRQSAGRGEPEAVNGQRLTLRVESVGAQTSVVSLAGELDLSTVPIIEGALFEQLRTDSGVIMDLTQLSFIDSSGIGLLIKAFRAVDGDGKLHMVIAPGSQAERVFQLTGVDRMLSLFAERTLALDALNGAVRD